MAAAGVPMRTLQEWLGHRDFNTTLIYADYQPAKPEADLIEQAFGGHQPGIKLSASERTQSKRSRLSRRRSN
jgi:hypothetical protein